MVPSLDPDLSTNKVLKTLFICLICKAKISQGLFLLKRVDVDPFRCLVHLVYFEVVVGEGVAGN